jgi:hypothetical protein
VPISIGEVRLKNPWGINLKRIDNFDVDFFIVPQQGLARLRNTQT